MKLEARFRDDRGLRNFDIHSNGDFESLIIMASTKYDTLPDKIVISIPIGFDPIEKDINFFHRLSSLVWLALTKVAVRTGHVIIGVRPSVSAAPAGRP